MHPEPLNQIGLLKQAVDGNDLTEVIRLMTSDPALHQALLGYANNGPLTWVAECRIPLEPPAPIRLQMAEWMIRNGSDVHQGGDGPLMRAALRGERVPMMELLVAHGADVNAEWNGDFPILFAPCEAVDPVALRWLLNHGADPNCSKPARRNTALDYLIGTYVRSPQLGLCIDVLRSAGGTTRYDLPGVLATVEDRVDGLAALIEADPTLVHRRYPELDCGSTGGRRLLLKGATLLHVAAEYGSLEAAKLLLARGAEVNARADIDETGLGGQTALFHAASQFHDHGLPLATLLLDSGADLSLKATLPGRYDQPDDVVTCTALGYALRFPGVELPGSNRDTIALLRSPSCDGGGVE